METNFPGSTLFHEKKQRGSGLIERLLKRMGRNEDKHLHSVLSLLPPDQAANSAETKLMVAAEGLQCQPLAQDIINGITRHPRVSSKPSIKKYPAWARSQILAAFHERSKGQDLTQLSFQNFLKPVLIICFDALNWEKRTSRSRCENAPSW